jgi:hypothetical protein
MHADADWLNVLSARPTHSTCSGPVSVVVGEHFADLLVEDELLIEAKAAKALERGAPDAMRQLPQRRQPATPSAVEFRQTTPGNQTRGLRPANRS